MKLKERLEPKTQVTFNPDLVPRVHISREALAKMWEFIDQCADEIGWLGTAIKEGQDVYIKDVFLFDQEVHGTTTEITPEGLGEFGMELLQREDGVDIWNSTRVWGHSHVRMGVSPSSQDDKQMEVFSESGHEWFIRIIANKYGELKVDFYDFQTGITYLDVPWERTRTQEELDLFRQIDELYKRLDEISNEYSKDFKEEVKAEMAKKVRKKYIPTTTIYKGKGNVVVGGFQSQTNFQNNKYGTTYFTGGGKTTEEGTTDSKYSGLIETLEDALVYFHEEDLIEMGMCNNIIDIRQLIDDYYGYGHIFTNQDLRNLMNFGYRLLEQQYKERGFELDDE